MAISYAAYRAMLDLFPSDTALFVSLMNSLGYNSNGGSTNTMTPTGVGNVAAQAVISYRHGDWANQLNGYADTTGYVPKNDPTLPITQINPLFWQPLIVNGRAQKYLTPHWGTVAPFALTSSSQFRPAGPVRPTGPVQNDPAYQGQAITIVQYNANLTDTTKTTADYWANGPHSETPPGHWELFAQYTSAQYVSHRNNNDSNADVKMFFALSNAVFDAGISRQYGGIHFNQGDQDGRVLGKQVATVVWAKAQSYINATPG
jgi:hypothetical protein